tara:strand:+ start:123 stop:488 length:366 start_codon:yes stop_codon:yes gene_type:complete
MLKLLESFTPRFSNLSKLHNNSNFSFRVGTALGGLGAKKSLLDTGGGGTMGSKEGIEVEVDGGGKSGTVLIGSSNLKTSFKLSSNFISKGSIFISGGGVGGLDNGSLTEVFGDLLLGFIKS